MSSVSAQTQPQQFEDLNHLPFLLNNQCYGTRPAETPYGTQLYGPTGKGERHFTLFENTRTAWLRNSIYWNSVEPTDVTPDQYNWGAVEAHLRAAKDNCVNMIATIEGVPSWASTEGNRSPIKPANIPDFVEFMVALVERFDGDGIDDSPSGIVVHYWEIFNEPDFGSQIPGNVGYGDFGAQYAQLLEAIYQPVHDASEDVQVVFGGIAYNSFITGGSGLFTRSFFKDVLDAGGGDYFDYMNFHYYPFQHNRAEWTDGEDSGLREKYASLKAEMDAHSVTKPFLITEVGWHSSTGNAQYPSSEEFQARRVVELMAQGLSIGSEVTIWWTFFDELQVFNYRTGLTTETDPPSTKPSYTAYIEVLRRLGNSTFVANTVLPTPQNDLEAYEFKEKGTNRRFYVAWVNPTAWLDVNAVATFDDTTKLNLQVPGAKATIFSKLGAQVQVINDGDDGDSDGTVTISVGRSPIYIVMN